MGIFFTTATIAYFISAVLLNPILNSTEYLTKATGNKTQVIIGTYLKIIYKNSALVV